MKIYKSKITNSAYFVYRVVSPILDPIKLVYGLIGYIWFIRDYLVFNDQAEQSKLKKAEVFNINPQLHDKTNLTALDAHYFHQQLWLFEQVLKSKPEEHYDFGSTYQLSGYLSKIVPTTFCDIRPIDVKLPNFKVQNEDLTQLSFKNNSLASVSCLHVIEHIGLGRYGDKVDITGSSQAAKELCRVVALDGTLYLSTPVGKESVYFNAHRVFSPDTVMAMFPDFKLESFSVVDDSGNFYANVDPQNYKEAQYSCGMFVFKKVK